MDRLAQTALSAIRQMKDTKFDLAHNLSNVNVPGFRRDLPNEGNAAFLKELDKVSAKFCRWRLKSGPFHLRLGNYKAPA
jgi:flagellar basal-body rod protein FlgF